MTDFKDLVQRRRSHRQFTDDPVCSEATRLILRAALMSPTSKSRRGWHFYVVEDKATLQQLSSCKDMGGDFLASAQLAIVVAGIPDDNDCWIEDCSIAAISMQYQAEELGLGSCWAQMRNRGNEAQGYSATEAIRPLIGLPEEQDVLCIIGIGHPADERKPQEESRLKWEHVHHV